MSKYLPEGWTQDKIEEMLDFQRENKIYYCSACRDWVQDLPRKHVCESTRRLVEQGK